LDAVESSHQERETQSLLAASEIWPRRLQPVPGLEPAMFGRDRYATRVPNERELKIIELVAQGLENSEVAAAIGTTEHVIKNYLCSIYDKLGLWNRVELALWYEARRHREETMN
jgi:DNA-binding NarL/FixJ family response regulator